MNLCPGTPYDYSAAAHGLVFTAGACLLDERGTVVAPGDFEAQALRTVENLLAALAQHAVGPESLLKTRSSWSRVSGRSSLHVSVERRATLLGVSLLGYPDQLGEIEAIATIAP